LSLRCLPYPVGHGRGEGQRAGSSSETFTKSEIDAVCAAKRCLALENLEAGRRTSCYRLDPIRSTIAEMPMLLIGTTGVRAVALAGASLSVSAGCGT
jgi:hypothetical protein